MVAMYSLRCNIVGNLRFSKIKIYSKYQHIIGEGKEGFKWIQDIIKNIMHTSEIEEPIWVTRTITFHSWTEYDASGHRMPHIASEILTVNKFFLKI